jgi:hypothetical protein
MENVAAGLFTQERLHWQQLAMRCGMWLWAYARRLVPV